MPNLRCDVLNSEETHFFQLRPTSKSMIQYMHKHQLRVSVIQAS